MPADNPHYVGLSLPRKVSAWRVLKRVLLIVGLWYGLVLLSKLVCPQLSDGSPAMPMMVRASLIAHHWSVAQGVETFGDVAGSETLRRAAAGGRHRAGYLIRTFPSESGAIEAIVAYPRSATLYKWGPVGRVLFLSSAHHHLMAYMLMRDGQWYESREFSAAHPPTAADVGLRDSPERTNPWKPLGPLPPTTLPARSSRPGPTNPASRDSAGGRS